MHTYVFKLKQPHYTTLCICVYLLIYDETIVTFIKLIISNFIKGVLTTRRELRKPQVKEIVSLPYVTYVRVCRIGSIPGCQGHKKRLATHNSKTANGHMCSYAWHSEGGLSPVQTLSDIAKFGGVIWGPLILCKHDFDQYPWLRHSNCSPHDIASSSEALTRVIFSPR